MSNERNNPKSNRPSLRLSDTQLVLLSAAAQRDDHCLTALPNLKGGAAQKVADQLIAAALVKEIKAKAGAPVWRRDEKDAQSYALKLTAAGFKAIGVDEAVLSEGVGERTVASGASALNATSPATRTGRGSPDSHPEHDGGGLGPNKEAIERTSTAPRAGSKRADVIDRLRHHRGATIDELIAATNWLPHTTRAALTGLRKRGYAIERIRLEGITRYRIAELSLATDDSRAEAAVEDPPASALAENAA